jgi:hypothetical protein
MKLLSLKLYNFRPFYGEHGLSFAKTADRNITVIHGNNGGSSDFMVISVANERRRLANGYGSFQS